MSKQEPNVRKSIYPPVEIILDEEVYLSRKFTRSLLIEIAPHEKEIDKEAESDDEDKTDDKDKEDESGAELSDKKWDAYCNWMRIVFGVTNEKLEEAEFAEIEDAFMKVKTALLERSGNRMEKSVTAMRTITKKIEKSTDVAIEIQSTAKEIEKNVKGPGEKK